VRLTAEAPQDDHSISMLAANFLVLLSAGPAVAALALVYAARWGSASLMQGVWGLLEPKVLLLAVLPGVLAHELIHAAAWAFFAHRPLSAIQLGVRWRSVSPYAHPREPMQVAAYRAGAVMPAIVLGLGPSLAAIALGAPRLMAWGLVFVLAAGGDFVVLWLIRRVPAGRYVQDHPTRAGCQVLAPE